MCRSFCHATRMARRSILRQCSSIFGFLLGVAAGMRSMTPMAVVAWTAQLRWPQLQQTSLSFLTAPLTAYIFTACAALELVFDKLPFTPSRLGAGPLGTRILFGGLAAAALCAAGQQSIAVGAVVGAAGGIAGAFAGYHVRHYLTSQPQGTRSADRPGRGRTRDRHRALCGHTALIGRPRSAIQCPPISTSRLTSRAHPRTLASVRKRTWQTGRAA